MSNIGPKPLRVLAVVSMIKHQHIPYLAALGEQFDLTVAVNGEGRKGAIERACVEGLRVTSIGSIGLRKIEARLRHVIDEHRPHAIHVMYYYNEEMTLLARRVLGGGALVVHESRDPLTTLLGITGLRQGSDPMQLERNALCASDGQIFVTEATRSYLEETHGLDFSRTSLVVPQCFSEHNIASPGRKYSADDGRVHIALDGTVSALPGHARYYIDTIRRLVSFGFVVHSHFFENEHFSNEIYRELSSEIDDYHYHEFIPANEGTEYSLALSKYDLLGVFYEREAELHRIAPLLEICLPTKAVSAWLCGGIPTVCFPYFHGVVEYVRTYGLGFVADGWNDLAHIAQDRASIARATEACLTHRHVFTAEWNARRVSAFIESLLNVRQWE